MRFLSKKSICFGICSILFTFVLLTPDNTAFAQGAVEASTLSKAADFVVGGAVGLIFKAINNIIYSIALTLGGIVLGLGALMLDGSILILVVQMGERFTGGIGNAVTTFWTAIRDVLNIFFIFGLVYIGIKTILNSEDSGTRRSLGLLIAAALLINFSLLITQTIVDFSNILAVEMYNQILNSETVSTAGADATFSKERFLEPGASTITGAFMEASLINTFFDGGIVTGGRVLAFSLLMMFFLCVAGLSFLYGAIMIITRFIALVLYMVFSPLMFVGWIVPNFQSLSKKWWTGFIKQCFFAPIYLFLVFLSLKILEGLIAGIGTDATFSSAFAQQEGNVGGSFFEVFLYFIVMIGLLYASTKVGSMLSLSTAKLAMSGMGTAQGYLYRNTIGRGLNKAGLGMYDRLDRVAEGSDSKFKRGMAITARTIAGGEAGRQAVVKARDYGAGGTGYTAKEKMDTERSTRTQRNIQIDNIRSAISASKEGDSPDQRIKMEEKVLGASGAQIVEMVKDSGDKELIASVAGTLSDGQFKAIMDDKEIDDGTKTLIGSQRGDQVKKRLINNMVEQEKAKGVQNPDIDISNVISKADSSDLKALGFDIAHENAGLLTDKQISDWKELTPTQKARIKGKRKEDITESFKDGDNVKGVFEHFANDSERAKLPTNVLKNEASAEYLNTNVLSKILDNDGITAGDRADIKSAVLKYHSGKPSEAKMVKWFDENNLGQRY